MPCLPRPILSLFAAAILAIAPPLAAQCPLEWTPTPQQEMFGNVTCSLVWDSDGSGPLPSWLVVGGSDLQGGTEPAPSRVMFWDGVQWGSLGNGGPGNFGTVKQLEVWNGELFAAGSFTGSTHTRIARWDGAAWQPLGVGLPLEVTAMAAFGANLIVYYGNNATIAQAWNGVSWTTLPAPPLLARAAAAKVYRGELVVVGSSSLALGGTIGVLERWNGTSWATSITADDPITTLAVRVPLAVGSTPILYVGGDFTNIGGNSSGAGGIAARHVASTTGAPGFSWSPLGAGLSNPCLALHARTSALTGYQVVATESFSTAKSWNGSGSWTSMGSGAPNLVTYYSGRYHAVQTGRLLRHESGEWVPLRGPGLSVEAAIYALTPSGSDLILGGVFNDFSGVPVQNICRWDGTAATPLGSGLGSALGEGISALLTLVNGDILAGGSFTTAGGAPANRIARWNGSTWSPLGSGVSGSVLALAKLPNGDVIAGGSFQLAGGVPADNVARWNGTAWSPMGAGFDNEVLALVVDGTGRLFAGGRFQFSGNQPCSRIARWDGTQWVPVSGGMNGTVQGLASRPNGDLVAVGRFTLAGVQAVDRCARWNGTAWLSMGAASGDPMFLYAVHALPNGDVIAGRGFHQPGATVDSGISRWNGSTWSGLGNGITPYGNGVRAMAQRANGDLVIAGQILGVEGRAAGGLALLSSTCMPLVQPYGVGCSSGAGPLVLSAGNLPWLGATFRTTTTNIPANTLCMRVIGFAATSLPLASLVPQGQPGCTLLAAPDVADLLPLGIGAVTSQMVLAATPALLGAVFQQQTIPLEVDQAGALVAVRSSNALRVTVGTL